MNEFVILIETVASAGWVYLIVLLAIAVGFLLFDREPKQAAAESAKSPGKRLAA